MLLVLLPHSEIPIIMSSTIGNKTISRLDAINWRNWLLAVRVRFQGTIASDLNNRLGLLDLNPNTPDSPQMKMDHKLRMKVSQSPSQMRLIKTLEIRQPRPETRPANSIYVI